VVTRVLADLREMLAPFYSDTGRPSIDPELMLRMLIVGYCYGIRFERRLYLRVASASGSIRCIRFIPSEVSKHVLDAVAAKIAKTIFAGTLLTRR
jgi:Transposase domain (DUF772)